MPRLAIIRFDEDPINQRTSCPVNAYLSPGPGICFNAVTHVADNPLGTNVDVNVKPLSLCPLVASFKMISLKSDFFTHFFNDFIPVYSTGQGIQPLGDKLLMSTESPYHLARLLQV